MITRVPKVAPHVGAWIETTKVGMAQRLLMSHPMWVRGLKRPIRDYDHALAMSHPMWVRGLKPSRLADGVLELYVAPHVGAWIETCLGEDIPSFAKGRTPCGCVD